jgi:hypothetical protein
MPAPINPGLSSLPNKPLASKPLANKPLANKPLDLTKGNKVSNSFKAALDNANKIPGKVMTEKKDRNFGTKIASNNINSQTQGQMHTDHQRRDVGNSAKGGIESQVTKKIYAYISADNDYSIDEKDGTYDSFFNKQQRIKLIEMSLNGVSFD